MPWFANGVQMTPEQVSFELFGEATRILPMDEFEQSLNLENPYVVILGRRYPAGSALRQVDPAGFADLYRSAVIDVAGRLADNPGEVYSMEWRSDSMRPIGKGGKRRWRSASGGSTPSVTAIRSLGSSPP